MSSQYTDANVSLKDLALTQFELARDIPAAIELMSPNPQTLDIQVRMLLLKINAALSNFKLSRLTVGIGIKDLSFSLLISFVCKKITFGKLSVY